MLYHNAFKYSFCLLDQLLNCISGLFILFKLFNAINKGVVVAKRADEPIAPDSSLAFDSLHYFTGSHESFGHFCGVFSHICALFAKEFNFKLEHLHQAELLQDKVLADGVLQIELFG